MSREAFLEKISKDLFNEQRTWGYINKKRRDNLVAELTPTELCEVWNNAMVMMEEVLDESLSRSSEVRWKYRDAKEERDNLRRDLDVTLPVMKRKFEELSEIVSSLHEQQQHDVIHTVSYVVVPQDKQQKITDFW
jgi:hypothetical protein